MNYSQSKGGIMSSLSIDPKEEKRVKGLGFLNNKNTDNFSARVITENGLVTTEQTQAIIDAANKYGNGTLAFTSRLTIECPGIPYESIDPFITELKKAGLETGGTGAKIRPIVSCKGTTCQYGLIDTFNLSKKIHERFYKGYENLKLPHKFKIAVGGCPNNCVKPDLNDLGIIGQSVPKLNEELCKTCKKCTVLNTCPLSALSFAEGSLKIDRSLCVNCGLCIEKCPFHAVEEEFRAYQIYIGGRWGKKNAIGKPLSQLFETPENVMVMIDSIIHFYEKEGLAGERFAQTVERIGFDRVEASLLN